MINKFINKTSRLFLSVAAFTAACSVVEAGTPIGHEEDVSEFVGRFLDKKYSNDVANDVRKRIKELNAEDEVRPPSRSSDTQERRVKKKPKQVIEPKVETTSRRGARNPGRVQDNNSRQRQVSKKVNNWSLGLAAGKHFGLPMRMAVELSRVVDDGKRLNISPMLTKGPTSNAHALLYTRGVDLAIVNADILGYYKRKSSVTDIERRINYITQLFHSELHIVVRPEVQSMDDLFGKVVNFSTKGTAAAYTGPEVFKRLGITVKKKFLSFESALNLMTQSDEISAMVFVTGKPHGLLNKINWPKGFKLLPIPYNQRLTDYYFPTTLGHDDYPGLIPKFQNVDTLAVPTLLVSYNWKPGTKRYRKLERFVDYMFKRWNRLLRDPHDDRWKKINLSAQVPGWNRLPIAQARLSRAGSSQYASGSSSDGGRISGAARAEMREQFEDFLRKYAKAKNIKRFTPRQREKLFNLFYQHARGSQ